MTEFKVEETHQGGCLCRAVRFTAEGPPKWTSYCHCTSCRKHTGAPVSAYVGYAADKVRFDAEPKRYASSPGVRRGFCGTCGSTLSFEGDRWPDEIHLHVGAFDEPERFAPARHYLAEERVSWLSIERPAL